MKYQIHIFRFQYGEKLLWSVHSMNSESVVQLAKHARSLLVDIQDEFGTDDPEVYYGFELYEQNPYRPTGYTRIF